MSLHDELTAPTLEQAVKNHRKLVRWAIRAHYSIAADNALAVVMPALEVRLAKALQEGRVPSLSLAEVSGIVDETL